MTELRESAVILMADDDEDDWLLVREALHESGLSHDLYSVADWLELMDYLRQTGRHCDPTLSPTPELILLDLNN